jgi:8-oxo-dGTP diphosphatase
VKALARRLFADVLDWPFPRPAARGLVEREHEGRTEYLFVRVTWSGGDQWVLPGGGIETGEDPRGTVTREVREETGLSVTVAEPVDAFAFESGFGPHVATVFRCVDPEGVVDVTANPDSEPITEARWVPAGEVGDLAVPEDLAAVLERVVG